MPVLTVNSFTLRFCTAVAGLAAGFAVRFTAAFVAFFLVVFFTGFAMAMFSFDEWKIDPQVLN
jgi:hypothetical protein